MQEKLGKIAKPNFSDSIDICALTYFGPNIGCVILDLLQSDHIKNQHTYFLVGE